MIRVLFAGRKHRMRRRETILNPPEGIEFVPQFSLENMGKDEKVTGSLSGIMSNYIGKRFLKNIDVIYSCGKVLFNNFPYVIEIDNPISLCYYNLTMFNKMKRLITKRLKSKYCKAIICISNAARQSMINTFKDEEINKKLITIFPYVRHYERLPIVFEGCKFRILFVGYNFYLKGGKELLEVFNEIKQPDWELIMVTNHIASFKQVEFINPDMDKEKLYCEYYRQCDVFVQPTFQDSFGMVNLEAVSAGLPVIATDVFALPEIVENGSNGFLMSCPVSYFTKDFLPNPKWWNVDIAEFAKENTSNELKESLKVFLTALYEDKELRQEMAQNSLKLANTKFSEEKRKALLKKVLEEAIK